MADKNLFEKIVDGDIPAFKVWESDTHLAFLTPFPSTPGATVVIPKKNPGGYVFDLDDADIAALMSAAKQVATLLQKAFGAEKIAAVFEGEAVPHVHVKLFPMHDLHGDRSKFPKAQLFFPVYPGYIRTAEGPRMSDDELASIQAKIKKAAA